MIDVRIAFYDDVLNTEDGESPRETVAWLEAQPNCEVRAFSTAAEMLQALVEGYRPHIGVIDISGRDADNPSFRDVKERFDEAAKIHGLDAYANIDAELMKERHVDTWLEQRYYGVGLLAVLRAAKCQVRMALTNLAADGPVVEVLLLNNLANAGVCPKEAEAARRRLTNVITEMRDTLKAERHVPDLYDLAVVEELDDAGDEGWIKQLRVRIDEKKTPQAVKS
ncbi:MAG TPA: hypothetical protein VJM31_04335 [Vicinamibacterales bacterium]|nr:hypothetical protein [Vicinamibacterales bacterium]